MDGRDEDDVVEQDDLELEIEDTDEEQESIQDDAQENDPEHEAEPDEDEEERVVTIGEAEPEEPETPGWVKKVRKVNRKLESEVRKLKKELEQRSTAARVEAPPVQLGEKPTLRAVGYDDKKYEVALVQYYDKKRQVDQYEAERTKKQAEEQQKWQEKQARYVAQKNAHKFKDFAYAEEIVSNTFNITQQGILVQGSEDSALVVYALGKNPKKLEELAKETDPVSFAFKVAKLEAQLKVVDKRAPSPEKRVGSGAKSGALSGSEDQTLERLRAEAAKTGDYTKVTRYKQKKRAK